MSIRKSTFRKYYMEIEDYCLHNKYISPSSNCGMFMYRLRTLYNEGMLEDQWIKILEEIDFPWRADTPFEKKLKEIQKYFEKKNKYPPATTQLGAWVSRMRHLKKIGHLSQNKLDKLNSINFKFND